MYEVARQGVLTPARGRPEEGAVPELQSLADLLLDRAASAAMETAYTFVDEKGEVSRSLSFSALAQSAAALAERLQVEEHLRPGDRILLAYPPDDGIQTAVALWACVLGGFIAVPILCPNPKDLTDELDRLDHIVCDCLPSLLLTSKRYAHIVAAFRVKGRITRDARRTARRNHRRWVRWLAHDLPRPDAQALRRVAQRMPREATAFLQYTSGSSGPPRGVRVSHRNALANLALMARESGSDKASVLISWVPLYHDMGLTGGILHGVWSRCHVVFFSPMAFIRRPLMWLEAVDRFGGTHIAAPNFGYDYLLSRAKNTQQTRHLDLSSLRRVLQGGEPARVETLERFVDRFSDNGVRGDMVRNVLGLAETVLYVGGAGATATRRFDVESLETRGRALVCSEGGAEASSRALMAAGAPNGPMGARVAIVDPETLQAREPGVVGEIFIAGPSIPEGYWGWTDQQNKSKFRSELPSESGLWLRTGDAGFLYEGELYVLGRLSDRLFISGRYVQAHEIEDAATGAHESVRPGYVVAVSTTRGAEHRLLIIVQLPSRSPWSQTELRVGAANAIAEAVCRRHRVAVDLVGFVAPKSLLKTSSGKLARGACREAYLDKSFEIIAEVRPTLGAKGSRQGERAPKSEASRPVTSGDGRRRKDSLVERWTRRPNSAPRSARRRDVPKVAHDFPILGHMPSMIKDGMNPVKTMQRWHDTYGPRYAANIPGLGPLVITNDPGDIAAIAVRELPALTKRDNPPFPWDQVWGAHPERALTYTWKTDQEYVDGIGVFKNSLQKPEVAIPRFGGSIMAKVNRLVAEISARHDATTTVIPRLKELLFCFLIDPCVEMTCGKDLNLTRRNPAHLSPDLRAFYDAVLNLGQNALAVARNPLSKAVKTKDFRACERYWASLYDHARDWLDELMQEHAARGDWPESVARDRSIFLDGYEDYFQQGLCDEKRLVCNIVEFVIGTADPGAQLMENILFQLARHPEAQEAVYDEILRVFGAEGPIDRLTLEDWGQLRRFQAFVAETCRYMPLFTIHMRRTVDETTLADGSVVPAGTKVIVNYAGMSSNEANYPRAGEFMPERFLGLPELPVQGTASACPFARGKINRIEAVVPFGLGDRACAGIGWAQAITGMAVVEILRNYRIRYHGPLDIPYHDSTPNHPSQPLDPYFKFQVRR